MGEAGSTSPFILYVRPACGLCVEAEAALRRAAARARPPAPIEVVDVTAEGGLERRYGSRVPVLARAGRDLCWGRFDRRVVDALVAEAAARP
jgi:hypothetical protein